MEPEAVTNNTRVGHLNNAEFVLAFLNSNIPRFLYKEIPAVFLLIGVLLNILIIIYFVKSKRYRSPLFVILTWLASMDACVCIGGAMYSILTFPTVMAPQLGFFCPVSEFLTLIGLFGSEYILLFFTALRLYQVLWPLKARASVTVALMIKYCAAIVMLSVCGAITYGLFFRTVTSVVDNEEVTVCFFTRNDAKKDLGFLITVTAIPCVTIFMLHIAKHIAYMRVNQSVEVRQERKNPDARAITIVIVLVYICLIPACTYAVIQHANIPGYINHIDNLFLILLYIMLANSILNPIVYVLAMKSIRDEVISLFCFRGILKILKS